MSLTHMMDTEHYERTRRQLAEWDAEAAARVEAKKAEGLYQRRPDPRKQQPIPAGAKVTFEHRGRKVTGRVVRHEDRKNHDGENDYGWCRLYWIKNDKTGQTVPVDSEKVEAADAAPANPHDAGSPGHPCGYGAQEQAEYDATVAHMGREW